MPRKSANPCAPPLLAGPEIRAFLRGMFDGAGCLHETKRGYLQAAFTGHPDIVKWFVWAVGVGTNGVRLRNGTAYAQWTSGPLAKKVCRVLYPGEPSLDRKAAIAERWV